MKTFKRIPVYKKLPTTLKPGRTNLAMFNGMRGVYKLYEDRQLIYIGSSTSNLYKTILRHFQGWNDSQQPRRITYKSKLSKHRYSVEVTLIKKVAEIHSLEEVLIAKHKPRDNKDDNYNPYNPKYKRGKYATYMDCYKSSLDEKLPVSRNMSYNSKGQLLDENGEVVF